jgi:GDPmannose 4,6-dehydratase
MKVAFITGITGQDGSYLAELLLDKSYKVHGFFRRVSLNNSLGNIQHILNHKNLTLHNGDMTDCSSLLNTLRKIEYTFDSSTTRFEIYNLAAQSFVGSSWKLAHTTTQVNAQGVLNCLEVIKDIDRNIRFYQAGTSEMFGNANIDGYQTEDTPFMPVSPYGTAKLYAYHITRNFRESYGMYACNGILFNHESPIRGLEFVTRKITDGVARIVWGKDDKIVLGNLDAERDWGYAGDFVEAMHLMMQGNEPKDYIVATGVKHSIRDVCRIAFTHAGIEDWEPLVTSSSEFKRLNELDKLRASSNKAQHELGWTARVGFEELIKMMMTADLRRYAG